jgi:hypothetical protein
VPSRSSRLDLVAFLAAQAVVIVLIRTAPADPQALTAAAAALAAVHRRYTRSR